MRVPFSEDQYYDQYEISDAADAIEHTIARFKSPIRFKIIMDGDNRYHVELYGTKEEFKKLLSKFAK